MVVFAAIVKRRWSRPAVVSSGFVGIPPSDRFAVAGVAKLNMSAIAPVISIITKAIKGRCRRVESVDGFGEKTNSGNALRGGGMSRCIKGNPWRQKRALKPHSGQEIPTSHSRFRRPRHDLAFRMRW